MKASFFSAVGALLITEAIIHFCGSILGNGLCSLPVGIAVFLIVAWIQKAFYKKVRIPSADGNVYTMTVRRRQ